MKTQITSILLCALVCSTLGLDYLSARRFVHEVKSSKQSLPLSNFQERGAVSERCMWICKESSNSSTSGRLQVTANATKDLFKIVNATAGVALVLDVETNLVALFNGTSGAVIVVNIENGSGIYIAGGQSAFAWLSTQETPETHFGRLTSLQVIFNSKVGIEFEISSVTTVILTEIGSILSEFSYEIRLQIQRDFKISLSILLKISSSFSGVLRGSLKGVFKLFNEEAITIHWDIIWLIQAFSGLEIVILRIDGGLETLIKADVRNLNLFLASSTGIESFINLLLSIVVKVDLAIIRGINEPLQLLQIISVLSGHYTSGINGIFQIIAEIAYINEGSNGSIRNFTEKLLEFSISTDFTQVSSETFTTIVGGLLKIGEIQKSRYSSSISGFILFAEHLQNGTFKIGSEDISSVIVILLRGPVDHYHDQKYIRFIVSVLLRLSTLIKPQVAISTLVLYLVSSLTNVNGIIIVKTVITALPIDVSNASDKVIIKKIFEGVNIDIIISLCTNGFDVNNVLRRLPIIRQIYNFVSIAVTIESSNKYNLAGLLTSSSSVVVVQEIEAWVKWAIYVRFGYSITIASTTSGAVNETYTRRGPVIITPIAKSGHINAHSNNNVKERHHMRDHHKV